MSANRSAVIARSKALIREIGRQTTSASRLSKFARAREAVRYGKISGAVQATWTVEGNDKYVVYGGEFLAVNGIQTMSHGVTAFCPTAEEARAAGLARLRLSPHTFDMTAVAATFRRRLAGAIDRAEAHAALKALGLPGELVDGFTRGVAGSALAESA